MHEREAIRTWIEQAIIALNLCPFAAKPYREGLVHLELSRAKGDQESVDAFLKALDALLSRSPYERATTLLAFIHPEAMARDFDAFMLFVRACERVLRRARMSQFVQLAHFHPDYRFAQDHPEEDGVTSFLTNTSPYPVLHLLRAEDVEEAVARHPDTLAIPHRNIATLRALPAERRRAIWPRHGAPED